MADADKVTGFEVRRDGVKLNDVTYTDGTLTINNLEVDREDHTSDITLELKALTKTHVNTSPAKDTTLNLGKARSGEIQSIVAAGTTETTANVTVDAGAD